MGVGSGFQQRTDYIGVAIAGGGPEPGRRVGSSFQQRAYYIGVAIRRSHAKSAAAGVGSGFQQANHHTGVAIRCGGLQDVRTVSPGLDKGEHHIFVTIRRGHAKSADESPFSPLVRVGIRSSFQEGNHHGGVAIHRSFT